MIEIRYLNAAFFVLSQLLFSLSTVLASDASSIATNAHSQSATFPIPEVENITGSHTCSDFAARRLSLAAAIEIALCRSPRIRAASLNIRSFNANLEQKQAAYFPILTGTVSSQISQQRSEKSTQINSTDHGRSSAAEIDVAWVIFDFGSRRATQEQARNLLEGAVAFKDEEISSLILQVAQAYLSSAAYIARADSLKQSEDFARENYTAAHAKYNAGVGSRSDELQALTALSDLSLSLTQASGQANQTLGELCALLGIPANSVIEIDPISAIASNDIGSASIDELMREAVERHPTIRSLRAQLLADKEAVNVLRAEDLPTVSVVGSSLVQANQGGRMVSGRGRSNSIGIQISFPLSDGKLNHYKIEQAVFNASVSEQNLEAAKLKVGLETFQSFQEVMLQRNSALLTENLVSAAAEAAKVAQGRYRAGVGSILELMNAQTNSSSAAQKRIQSIADLEVARIRLALSLGRL